MEHPSTLQEDFEAAAEEAKTLPNNTSNEDKLALYGLFKQAKVGDNETSMCITRKIREICLSSLY